LISNEWGFYFFFTRKSFITIVVIGNTEKWILFRSYVGIVQLVRAWEVVADNNYFSLDKIVAIATEAEKLLELKRLVFLERPQISNLIDGGILNIVGLVLLIEDKHRLLKHAATFDDNHVLLVCVTNSEAIIAQRFL